LRMGGGGGMDREAARVPDVGDMVEQLQRIDEAPAAIATAGKLDADQPAEATGEVTIGAGALLPS
jgi:hypothetical protein